MSNKANYDLFLAEVAKKMGVKKSDIWKHQYNQACRWIYQKGFDVVLNSGAKDEVIWDLAKIVINKNYKWETRYYSLLHEIGHIVISENKESFSYDYPFYVEVDKAGRKSNLYKLSTIGEEIEAWKFGRSIGDKELHHFINYDKYDKLMTECVMSYIYWAAES